MNDMRKLINLMEGIESVPGLNEKSTSEKQARFMAAAAHNADFAKKADIDQDVAKEFNKADTGTEQLSNAMKEEMESDMQTAATAANDAGADGFDAAQSMATESEMNTPNYEKFQARFIELMDSYVEPQEAFDVVSREMDEEGIDADEQDSIVAKLEDDFFPGDSEPSGSYDMSDDADALASAGFGSDEDYGGSNDMEFEEAFDSPMDEAFDLQNGYDDINDASGNDYFPNGADGPVVRSTGPSGARQGDNPEQKKMQVAEVHKELVYGYRNFLKESAQLDQKKN